MNLFSPPRKVTSAPPQPAATLRVQTSAQGQARAVGWGQARLAGNLIGFWNFDATAVSQSVQGGKGGGGGTFVSGYTYSCSPAIGLCEGTIKAILQAWSNKTPENFIGFGWTFFSGSYGQDPWPWLAQQYPGAVQNFRGLAYAANSDLGLGTDPALLNLTFEVRFGVSEAVAEIATVPASGPYTIAAAYYDVTANGANEEITVPYATPAEYEAQNPQGLPFTQTGIVSLQTTFAWSTVSSGIFYTDTDPPAFLTPVTGTPSAGQYKAFIGAGVIIDFNAADAGTAVTLVDLAVSPGVFYGSVVTANAVAGSATLGALSSIAGIAAGYPVAGAGVAPGSVVLAVSGGAATGAVSLGSPSVAVSGGSYDCAPGVAITDSAGLFPAGAEVVSSSFDATFSGGTPTQGATEAIAVTLTIAGNFGAIVTGSGTITLSSTTGVMVGALVTDSASGAGRIYSPLPVISVGAGTITVNPNLVTDSAAWYPGSDDIFTITFTTSGTVTAGSAVITNLPLELPVGAAVADALGLLPSGASITASAGGTIVLSAPATGNNAADVISFLSELVLSLPATETITPTSIIVTGAALQQIAGPTPEAGQFTLTPQGVYTFNAADAGKTVIIIDTPDANPADVLADFLTNQYYGVPLFSAARLGDLSTWRNYCAAAGLFVSPVLTSQQQATQLLQDLMTATNSQAVWSAGLLTVVPYGDAALSGNGAGYTPPSQPLYSLGDDDFLPNEATNSASVSAADSPDPVTVTRLDPGDQVNDIQVEYLDRTQDYNPVIAEAQDDALINLYGLKPSGSKQLHLLCDRKAAMLSAQLQLGRQQIRNIYSFTVGREFILLDPMDIIAISDAGLGLAGQWVRIREITENQDRTLSITAEEYLAGTGAAPRYGHQAGAGYRPNFEAAPGDALAPVIIDAPAQLVQTLGLEGWIATNGGPLWGGCEVWISSDDVNFTYAGTMQGGAVMGTLTAALPLTGIASIATTIGVASAVIASSANSFTGAVGDPITSTKFPAGTVVTSVSSDHLTIGTSQGALATASGAFSLMGWSADRVNTLSVDLTESSGALLPAASQADADNGNTLCFIADGANSELVAYEQAALTAQYKYALGKDGATAGYLARGVWGDGVGANTVSHAIGCPFVRLRPNSLFKLPYLQNQIGNTLYVKLLSFNLWGGGRQGLEDVSSYSHTIGGSAPALSDVAALALYEDLDPGAATGMVSVRARPAARPRPAFRR